MLPSPNPSNQSTQSMNSRSSQKTVIQSNLPRNGIVWGLGIISVFFILILLVPRIRPTPLCSVRIDNGKLCLPNTPNWNLKVMEMNPDEAFIVVDFADLTLSNSLHVGQAPPKIYLAKSKYDSENYKRPIYDLLVDEQQKLNDKNQYPSEILDTRVIDIGDKPAFRISYKSKKDQTKMQVLRYGIRTIDTFYLITFEAEEKDYPMIEAEAEKIIQSITFPDKVD